MRFWSPQRSPRQASQTKPPFTPSFRGNLRYSRWRGHLKTTSPSSLKPLSPLPARTGKAQPAGAGVDRTPLAGSLRKMGICFGLIRCLQGAVARHN